jgi:hypothetical protein
MYFCKKSTQALTTGHEKIIKGAMLENCCFLATFVDSLQRSNKSF